MNARTKHRHGPVEAYEVVEDFLPSPDELAFKEDTVKVTIALSESSVEFFKAKAAAHNTAYQKLIRRLLDAYVDRHSSSESSERHAGPRAQGRNPDTSQG